MSQAVTQRASRANPEAMTNKRVKRLVMRLTPEEHRELKVVSAMAGESMETFMRRAVGVTAKTDAQLRQMAAQT